MSVDIGLLAVGVNVDIQRTDGRMHSAVISGFNMAEKGVTVEWFENGETKGKEIDMETIFSLNGNLRPAQGEPPAKRAMESARPEDSSADVENRAPVGTNRSEKENHRGIPRRDISSAKSRRSFAARQIPTREVKSVAVVPPTPTAPPISTPAVPAVSMADAKKPNTRRRSNCLKEVEKIKIKRDERRAAQVAIKEYTNEEYDTSHPQWEFLAMIREFRDTLDYRPLTTSEPLEDHQISVCVRKRPLSKKELGKREVDVVTVPNKCNLMVHEPKTKVDLTKYLENQNFRFDYAFDDNVTNDIVYRFTAKPLVECIFDRGMATCFAYGQTGSGKTHTMGGDFSAKGQQDTTKGIYALAAQDLFLLLNSKYKKMDLVASASFFEIYSGKVFDLLNDKCKLRVLEDGKQQVQVVGLKEETIAKEESVLTLIQHGNSVRTSGQTSANQHSSRSHAVFQLILRKKGSGRLHGKFSLIDLAGNERGADTMSSDRNTRMEGAEINKSLLALKECIRALGHKGSHLPFRASKLTQVLRDSFIGDKSRTCMIAMISPGLNCCEHTINTLRYADRVKELGPAGAGEGRYEAKDMMMESDVAMGCMSPQNSDLAMIKTTNAEELSDEFLNFHEAMNIMQELEEEVIDQHKSVIDQEAKWLVEDKKLHKLTEEVEYDVEGYARSLEALMNKKMAALKILSDKVAQLRRGMDNEESVCQTIKSKKSVTK